MIVIFFFILDPKLKEMLEGIEMQEVVVDGKGENYFDDEHKNIHEYVDEESKDDTGNKLGTMIGVFLPCLQVLLSLFFKNKFYLYKKPLKDKKKDSLCFVARFTSNRPPNYFPLSYVFVR